MPIVATYQPVVYSNHSIPQNGSTENGTIRESGMLVAIKNWSYLCNAF